MSKYAQGRRAEYKSMRVLEACGYTVTRSASSKGRWDVVGVSGTDVLLVQVKAGKTAPARAEMDSLRELRRPPNCRVLVHWWKERAREPVVYEL